MIAGLLSRREMFRALGVLYAVGGSLALLWTTLPHEPDQGDAVAVVLACLAIVIAFGLVGSASDDTPLPLLHVAMVVIQLMIAVGYVAEGEPGGDGRLFFIWATPYAAFYFGARVAAAHTLWTGTVLAASLWFMPAETHDMAAGVFLISMGTVAATGCLVSWAAHKLREAVEAQRYLALHDPLTGLPNRAMLAARASDALRMYAERGGTLAVMIIDLDRFKLVNDTYGHSLGDKLLKEAAPRLINVVRDSDLVVRLGGDEFGILAYDADREFDVGALASRVAAAWVEPILLKRTVAIHTAASIGVAVATSAQDSAESLLRDADAAMYVAKRTNPGGWALFDDGMREGMAERLELEHLLSEAISGEELSLVYQPIADLSRSQTCHAETLLRWNSPVRGVVSPNEFIAVAEETGLIFAIGSWVLRTALGDLAKWRSEQIVPDGFVLTVNVSGRELRDGFSREVAAGLDAAGVPGTALGVEITENALINDPVTAARAVTQLRALGVKCVLDDFGTGYSSLAHLQNFPLDAVKLDRCFLTGVDWPIVESFVALGGNLGLAVVAEGIETAEHARSLTELGCVWGQGYFFGEPMTASEFEAHLASRAESVEDESAPLPAPASYAT
ncbi:MAG: EAL domain-containing protein [Nocardioidaceae bacterium]|nr:EAL domain-containing protein [Nocardioidaceae bacterium]